MDHTQAVAALASHEHPLIDIDGTVFVQFGLFVILYFVANKMLFQPYLKLREKRRAGIEGARAEAESMSGQADSKLAEYEKQLAVARAKGTDEARKLRSEAAAHEREVTEKARTETQKAIDEATSKMRSEVESARKELLPQANTLAQKMASKLLGREVA
ncbi:MAG TPA: ATP synthase F0 subunit B [Kofleriaceae bacterium]